MVERDRILKGVIIGETSFSFPDGKPDEPRVTAELASRIWDIPTEWFRAAGHTILDVGTQFSARTSTPYGLVPRSLDFILPPVESRESEDA